MITIFPAMQNADLTEGRGPMVAKAYFTNKADADQAARRLDGVMGIGFGQVGAPVEVYESFDEWPGHVLPERPDAVRARAIEKIATVLSPEEMDALGLKRG